MDSILFSIDGVVATITLNRPSVFNSFNREMALLLQAKLDECATNPAIRAVYLTANGKAFCAGQDIQELVGDNPMPIATILSEHYNPIVQQMRDLPKPIVVAVNGVAAGAGANIALAADVVVAHENASFIQAFSKIGLIPDSGGTYTLPRLIGLQRASALMMLGDKLSAADAQQMGMLYKVFDDATFAEESYKLAVKLGNMPTRGLALTKQALNDTFENSFNAQLKLEDILQQKAAQTEDYAEGIQSFIEKRKPTFTGK